MLDLRNTLRTIILLCLDELVYIYGCTEDMARKKITFAAHWLLNIRVNNFANIGNIGRLSLTR